MFTKKEEEIMMLILEGCNNIEISEKLMINIHTVKAHVTSILHELKVHNRIQAIIKYIALNKD